MEEKIMPDFAGWWKAYCDKAQRLIVKDNGVIVHYYRHRNNSDIKKQKIWKEFYCLSLNQYFLFIKLKNEENRPSIPLGS